MATHANGGTREDDPAFSAVNQPRQILSLADHVVNVPDMAPPDLNRQKKAKKSGKRHKSKRKEREFSSDDEQTQRPRKKVRMDNRQVHQISDSDFSGELEGFQSENLLPVFSRRDRSSVPKSTSRQALPAWLSAPTPPGPWDAESSDSDDEVEVMDVRAPASPQLYAQNEVNNGADAQGLRKKANVSLEQYMQVINTDEDVAPNVWPDVASLVEATWGKQHKDDIKQIYDSHKRPANTPSLQKVVLDPELDSVLGDRYPRSKRTDATLQAIGNAISKAAVCLTEILHTNMSDMTAEATTKATLAKSFDAMRVLAYGHAKLQHTRRDMIKSALDPAVSRSLNRNASVETSNSTHKLFGGDVHKQAKEGWLLF